ncbi:MAG: C4-dicarboxylate ABC transporter [Methylocystaceae bacterium]|nr:C4-dicarboxylate ABC transporter [Methylocystaceae bacterium]
MKDDQAQGSSLQFFPIPMFATAMGLSGLTIATHKLSWIFGENTGDLIFHILAYLTLGVYIAVLAAYTIKSLRYPQAVLADWSHPIKISFFPAASISLLLLGVVFFTIDKDVSFFLWATGGFFQFFLSMAIINSWIDHPRYEINHSTPAWFIPVVGNIIVPVVGVEHAPHEISWFFFAWGMLFWIILLTLIMNRLMFHGALAQKLLPTLFIFLAPPSIGFVSYVKLTGGLDSFGKILYYLAAFFFFLLVSRIHRMMRLKFSMASWAFTFPLAAFTIATHLMGTLTGHAFFEYLSIGLYVITACVIVGMFIRTAIALVKCEICVGE